jgi:hypothetical protein
VAKNALLRLKKYDAIGYNIFSLSFRKAGEAYHSREDLIKEVN